MVWSNYIIEYMDGKEEPIHGNRVVVYWGNDHTTNFMGTGCRDSFLEQSLKEKRPIIIAKEFGKPKAERIINTHNIRAINVLESEA